MIEIFQFACHMLAENFCPFFRPLVNRRISGAGCRNRTRDLLITNQLLYQLSYASLILLYIWSGKRDSNPQPTAWKAVALAN